MAKLIAPFLLLSLLGLACSMSMPRAAAAVHEVGDEAGWDISTDFQLWLHNKTFLVGDLLSFAYSTYHTVNEVTKAGYDNCTVDDVLLVGKDGNTTVVLTTAGTRYFISGNMLYCFGGMKMRVDVVDPSAPAASLPPVDNTPTAVTGDGSWPRCRFRDPLGLAPWTFLVALAHFVASPV